MYQRLTSSSTLLNLAQALAYHKTYELQDLVVLILQHAYYLFGMRSTIEQNIQSNFLSYCLRHICLFENHINQRTTMHEDASAQDAFKLEMLPHTFLIVCSSLLSLNAESFADTPCFDCDFCCLLIYLSGGLRTKAKDIFMAGCYNVIYLL